MVDDIRVPEPWATGDQVKRMLTLGDTWEPVFNKAEGFEDQITDWKLIKSCYANDHWDCKYYEDCYHSKRYRCHENHRIAIKVDQFDGEIFPNL